MHMRKQTALLVAAVGTLLISGTGGAAADPGPGPVAGANGGSQSNRCDTSSAIGPVTVSATPTEINNETDCVNYAESGVAEQKNRCRTHSVIGPITVALAPGSEINNRTNCVNVSKSGGVRKQTNDCQTTSVLGPITIGPGEVNNETNCANVASSDPENGKQKKSADGKKSGKSGGQGGRQKP
ncbi:MULTISPECIES: hypothetical protein [Streptomyces violaceusniger group]|uniref:Secreted protein n=2 Tax=Streptomyces violaceusniger group TaxID=2839105 RepID=A0ABD5JEP5_9ACTN|nr:MULTISPECIES: hypothetical protein [Streptomyces]KUL46852.1 hypothetical protein ADL28_33830 [Streptomyces violaceusniger]MEE4586871.1 hypothetical protein [Streptomyces sp. DSM 41602]WJD98179.1 hypothetical protein QR300_20500 [Streptomyces antimycoticus]